MGGKIQILSDGSLKVPDVPIIPYIERDGVGPDIWKASIRVFDGAAVFEATHGTPPQKNMQARMRFILALSSFPVS